MIGGSSCSRSRSCSFAVPGLFSLLSLFALSAPCLAQDPGGSPGPGGPSATNSGYVVQYSGGTIKGTPFIYNTSPRPGSAGSATGIINQSAKATNGQAGTCSITASDGGPITAQITWNGGKANTPAPPAAIVMETSTAVWGGTVGDSPAFVWTPDPTAGLGSGVSVTGAGSDTQYTFSNGSGYPSAKGATGTKYSAATSGQSTTTTCNPSFVLKGTTGTNSDSYEYCTMQYTYSAQCFPVTISLTGTTPDASGNLNILVGQHCSASLAGIPPSLLPNTTYSWTVSGNTFQTWSADTPANGNDSYNSDASYEVDGPGPLTNSTAGWYWNDHAQTPETVSCTATVTPPAGQGSAFTVTVTQKVTVMVPQFTLKAIGGTMQVSTAMSGGNGTDYYLYAGPTAGTSQGAGMEWDATVSSPPGTTFGAGSLELVQLLIPNRSYTTAGLFGSTSTHSWSMNGQEGLDAIYPYGWDAGAPAYETNDTPSFDLTAVNAQSAQMGDQFEDYLMYFAPSSSQCVPLARFVWSINGNVTIPGTGNWADFGAGSAGTVTPSGVTIIGPSNAFPMWTQIITATSGSF